MRNTLLVAALLAVGLSACGQKEEAAQTEAAPAPVAEAPAPAPMAEAPAAEASAEAPAAAEAAVPAATSAPAPAAAPTPAPAAAPAPATAAATAGDAAAGAAKFTASCASCHGAKGQGIGTFPKLAGQSADMIKSKMATYKAGKQIGPQSAVMMPLASMLSDADVANLAAHIATLK